MDQKKQTPQVRFKGYIDTWEQRKLSDKFSDFIVPMRDKPKEFCGQIPWTRIEDIEGRYLNGTLSGQYVSHETIKDMNLKIIPKDSLIVSSSATFGVVAIVTQDLITNQTFIGLVPNDRDTLDFWYIFFQSNDVRRYMKLESAGSTIFYIARESFEKMPIKIPSKVEMKKIGQYFSQLDNLITLHQRKYDKLLNLKKAMLEKMFPQNGSLYPEIRFKGYTDVWEQRKLNTITDVRDGTHDSPKYVQNGHPFITSKNVGNGFINYDDIQYISDKDYDEINKRSKVDIYDILMGMIGTIGNLALIHEKPDFAIKNVALIKYTGDIDYKFLYQILQSHYITSQLLNSMDGGTQKFIALNKIRELNIPYPIKEEQRQIGSFLEQLDNLITLHQRKIEKLKQIKKSCLEKMFV